MVYWKPLSKYEPDVDDCIMCPNCGKIIDVFIEKYNCTCYREVHCENCQCDFDVRFDITMTNIEINDDSIYVPGGRDV